MEANVHSLPRRSGPKQATEGFVCTAKRIKSNHTFQLFVDCGGEPGPWLAVGVNDTVYALGWVPEEYMGRP